MGLVLKDISYKEIHEGDKASFKKSIDENIVKVFASLSGDESPLHMDNEYAEKTEFGGRIIHGMLLGSLFSGIIGMLLPGKRALYLSQDLKFQNPLTIGETVEVSVTVSKKFDALKIIELETIITNEKGVRIVSGTAKVKIRD